MSEETSVIETGKFTILTVNDIYEVVPDMHGIGGMAELCTLLKKHKKEKDCFITMNGDFLSASALGVKLKGSNMIDIFNTMPFDILTIGNHEFDFGSDVLKERISETKNETTYLNSNIFEKEDQKLLKGTTEYMIQELTCGMKVGYFAVCTEKTTTLSQPGDKVYFENVINCAKRMVKTLHTNGCHCIVAITHLDIQQDRELAMAVPEINIILGGHDHSPFTQYQGETFIIKSGQNGQFMSKIEFTIEKHTFDFQGEPVIQTWIFPDWSCVLNKGYEPDQTTLKVVNHYQDMIPKDSSEVICLIKKTLDSGRERVRSRETNFANLICDALIDYFNVDIGFITGGSVRGDSHYNPGKKFTKGMLEKELPFSDKVSVIELTGAILLEAIEFGLAKCPQILGSFPHISKGFSIEYDVEETPGKRIKSAKFNGNDILPDQVFKCAGTSYIFNGGDGFTAFKQAKIIKKELDDIFLRDIVLIYMKKLKIIQYTDYDYRIYKKGQKNLWKFIFDKMK